MKKRYKLIYEDDDKLKGSYSGIPAKDDPALIDVAVLDGSEPVKPEPKPEPIDNAASIHALKEALELAAEGNAVDAEFEFDRCDFQLFQEMWDSFDYEAFLRLMSDGGTTLQIRHEGAISLPVGGSFYPASENSVDVVDSMHEFDSRGNGYSMQYSVSLEVDAETGDVRLVTAVPGFSDSTGWHYGEFTGKVILRYPGE